MSIDKSLDFSAVRGSSSLQILRPEKTDDDLKQIPPTGLCVFRGHQTPIVTSRWDLRAIVVAHRMFERWRQENFFKYLREEYLIDALVDYQVEPDDPNRSVPNPARKALEKEIHTARVHLRKLRQSYGATAIDFIHGRTRTKKAGFEIKEEKIRREIDKTTARIKKLNVRRDSLPARVPLADA
jgi:hypothetical protein